MRGLRPLGNFSLLTYQSPRPAWSSLRWPNQPSSITKRSTPRAAAFSASAILAGFSDVEFCRFPGVVDDGAGFGRGLFAFTEAMREDVGDLEVMQQARGLAEAVGRVAAVEDGCLERLAGVQHVAEVEGIEAAGDADGVELILLDGDAPGATPCERAEPDFAVIFVGVSGLDGEPWIGLMAGRSSAALEHALTGMQSLLGERPLAGPAAGEVVERVVRGRQGPGGRGSLLNGDGLRFAILDGGPARENAAGRVHCVVQCNEDVAANVLEDDVEAVGRRFVAVVVEDEVAVAIGESDLESRFDEEARAPAGVLLRRGGVGGIEGRGLAHGRGGAEVVAGCQAAAPVELLQLAPGIDAEDIGDVAAVEAEDLAGVVECGALRGGEEGCGEHGQA